MSTLVCFSSFLYQISLFAVLCPVPLDVLEAPPFPILSFLAAIVSREHQLRFAALFSWERNSICVQMEPNKGLASTGFQKDFSEFSTSPSSRSVEEPIATLS
eukprot:GHVP01059896.1.p1 GENE.GHVP01059896.1~~GHVP01059896.1.p1  ORF type:complete len:102 (+),score=8.48 GHVP01059896.1:89-394(+)